VAESVAGFNAQTLPDPVSTNVGMGITLRVIRAVFTHPLVLPKRLYVVVTLGVTDKEEPLEDEGAHVYDVAPPAISVASAPLHIKLEVVFVVTFGVGLTIRLKEAEFEQPPAPNPVTEYIVET
jgi:hypothetical protein